MNIKKAVILFITLSTISGISSAASAETFPPQPPSHETVTIINNASNTLKWSYQATFGQCNASPGNGSIPANEGQSSAVSCSWTADGRFNITDATGAPVGSVDAGYSLCRLLTNVYPYQISVSPDGVGSCTIIVGNIAITK